MIVYPESRIVNNCHVERTFLVRFTAGPVYGREGVLNGGWAPSSNSLLFYTPFFVEKKGTPFV